ncbi:uncharacterized protein LOC133779053 [Humulus lupulus]|uniref:uncharacterized protein LOC133779053 n=1 Tax=Humulus lupulus TaxID=3486 RepID=UPI002B40D537|nr:uncharacterized protein LOC133779053 [Humulus lupulus]
MQSSNSLENTLQMLVQTQMVEEMKDMKSQMTKLNIYLAIQECGRLPVQPLIHQKGKHMAETSTSTDTNLKEVNAITTQSVQTTVSPLTKTTSTSMPTPDVDVPISIPLKAHFHQALKSIRKVLENHDTFQHCMISICSDMIEKCMEVFMEDLIVFGDSVESTPLNLESVLERCKEKRLVLNWEKCHFMVPSAIVLGHVVLEQRIEVDQSKIELISKLPTPKTIKDILSFLGHPGFYRRLVYSKACHLPIKLEHKAYWVVKSLNFDLKARGLNRKLQLSEIEERRDDAYANSRIYKAKMKASHDKQILRKEFDPNHRVHLYDSCLHLHPGKLKSRWTDPYVVKIIFPNDVVEVTDLNDGRVFKVNGQRLKHYIERVTQPEEVALV